MPLIYSVDISEYQCIRSAHLELGAFTVIVGQNRSGKTAVLRAIQAALFNQTGNGFIRRGQKTCRVTLDVGGEWDGARVDWTKHKDGGAEYDVWTGWDGADFASHRNFTKLGSSVPDEVADIFNVREIEVDKTLTLVPQVHRFGENAFLINLSPGQAARALAKMTKLDVVVTAQGLARTDGRRMKQEQATAASTVTDLTTQMEEFSGLPEAEENLTVVQKKNARAAYLVEQVKQANWAAGRTETAARTVQQLEIRAGVVSDDDIDKCQSLYLLSTGALEAVLRVHNATKAAEVPELSIDIDGLDADIEKLNSTRNSLAKLAGARSSGELLTAGIAGYDVEVARLRDEMEKEAVCPTCGRLMEGDA